MPFKQRSNHKNVCKHSRLLSERGDLRLALISDLNGPYGSTRYSPTVAAGLDLLSELKPDLVLCAGDMVAGQKISLTDSQLEAMWSSFQSTILNPLLQQGIGMIPTMGNHDASSQTKASRYVFARERHQAESLLGPSEEPAWAQVHRCDAVPLSVQC